MKEKIKKLDSVKNRLGKPLSEAIVKLEPGEDG